MTDPYKPPSPPTDPTKTSHEPTTGWRDVVFIVFIILLMLFGNVLISSLVLWLRATFS